MKINFEISKNARLEILQKEGKELEKVNVLDVNFSDIPEDERSLILKYKDEYKSKFDLPYNVIIKPDIEGSTYQDLIKTLKGLRAKEEEEHGKEEERQKSRIEEVKKIIDDFLNDPDKKHFSTSNFCLTDYRKAEVEKKLECIKLQEAEVRRLLDVEKERKAEKEKKLNELLKTWAIENGSELLKLMIKHNQSWVSRAREEYALSIAPEGFVISTDIETETYEDACLKELKTFDAFKESHPDLSSSLVKWKKGNCALNIYEYEEEERIGIEIKITILDEEKVWLVKDL